MYSVKECREMTVWESSPDVYKVVCRRLFTGCNWMLLAIKKKTNMCKVGKYIGIHNYEMDTFSGNHFNLEVDLISLVLIPHIEVSIRYMAALQHFNSGTVVEWKLERSAGIPEYIFRYVFWAFKPAIDGFVHCRPVISIDGTHVYRKHNIKLLIDVAVDANGQIFPLVFAICANESQETWTLILNHLNEHIVTQCSGICLISNRHDGILSSVQHLPEWKEPYAYHYYCVRHLKANFQKKYPNKDLHDLMWMVATDHQECKFRRRMESIRQEDERAYHWLMRHDLEKCTLHADGGRRWGSLATNVLESFNRLLKSVCGLPVTAMVCILFKQMAERFVERHRGASELMERGVEFMPNPMKRFDKYRRRAHWHSFLQYCNERNIFEAHTAIHQNRKNNIHTVNEANRLCSYGKCPIYHMSRSHAIKCFQHTGLGPTDYVDKQYSVAAYLNTYSGQLQPVGHVRRKCPSASLGGGGNPAPGGSSSNVPNCQGYT
ncbi:uncharacterized protein [Nicotiana sylvestris]|uniref:uncharacterized protein n=1 Tax=Nicotiana sylvestris TaxID=4096 RepID=UPI00388CB28A